MEKYVVNVHFNGCIQFHVEADNEDAAKELAEQNFSNLEPEYIAYALCESYAEDAVKED